MNETIVRQQLESDDFRRFFDGEAETPSRFPITYLTNEDRRLFGCEGDLLWLSRISLDEHKKRHPEVTIDDYRKIPVLVRNGQVWAGHADRRYLVLWLGNKPYRAAIKVDAKGHEAWFLSLVISGKQKPPKGAVRIR